MSGRIYSKQYVPPTYFQKIKKEIIAATVVFSLFLLTTFVLCVHINNLTQNYIATLSELENTKLRLEDT